MHSTASWNAADHMYPADDILSWQQQLFALLDVCVSSLRRGHANLLCIAPILTDDPRREPLYLIMAVARFSTAGACQISGAGARQRWS